MKTQSKKNLRFTVAVLCMLLSSVTYAQQSYQSIFGNETTQWTITNRFTIPEDAWMDTILIIATENEYRVLEFQSKWSEYNQIIGKIRTNGTNSKLYFIEPDSTIELLIMDLDLDVGDSFNIKTKYYLDKIIYVDSVYVFNGKKHIRFNDYIGTSTPPGSSKRIFIEGVGPNWGFESDYPYLIACKYDNFVQTYSFENEHIKDCSFKNVGINDYMYENNIKIHPNPVFEQITINISEIPMENINLSIYNILGIEILNTTLSRSETVLDFSNFPVGLYHFKFKNSKNIIINKKIIKL